MLILLVYFACQPCGNERRVRFPYALPGSVLTNRIKGFVNFTSLKKGVLLTQTANAFNFVIPVQGCSKLSEKPKLAS